MWLQVEEVATTEIHWLKACASHFQTSVGYLAFSISQSETFLFFPIAKCAWNAICWCQVRIECHMLLSKFQPFDHLLADVLDQKKIAYAGICYCEKDQKQDNFLEVGGARFSVLRMRFENPLGIWLSNWIFLQKNFSFNSQFCFFIWLFWNITNVRIQFQCTNFVKIAHSLFPWPHRLASKYTHR